MALGQLIATFDDEELVRAELRGLSEDEIGARREALERAAQILRDLGNVDLADQVQHESSRFTSRRNRILNIALAPVGVGSKPEQGGNLALALDVILEPIPTRERYALIAQLVTDFFRPADAEQIRSLLKDRWRRLERRWRHEGGGRN